MKAVALPFLVVLALVGAIAPVQAANDATPQLRACSAGETDTQECQKPARAIARLLQLALAGDGWIVSETTSPIDYSPIATATTASRNVEGSTAMQLSIRCRGGRTELAVTGPAITGHGGTYSISYRANGAQPVQLAGVAASFGDGVAFKGDAVALLQSLPGDGELAVRLQPVSGKELEATFSLEGLEKLRTRIGPTCKWPHAVANPNER